MTQRASHPATAGLPREPSGSMPRPAHRRRLAAAVRPGAPGSHSQPPQRLWNGLTPARTNARWFRHTLATTPTFRIAATRRDAWTWSTIGGNLSNLAVRLYR